MKNKYLLTAALALLCCGLLSAQSVDGAFGGVFRKVNGPAEGEMAREGRIIVIFGGQGIWFDAFLARADGHTASLKPEGGTWFEKTGDGRDFSYNCVDDNFDYTMEVKFPSAEALTITDHFNAGASPFGMGMTLGGDYELDYSYVVDVNGYVYQKVAEGTELELCAGGLYKGTVELPETVLDHGETYRVAGVGEKAFYGNRDVTDLRVPNKDQYIKPAALYRSGIRYGWEYSFNAPGYIYPDMDKYTFVRPEAPEEYDVSEDFWLLFKHYYAPLTYVKDRRGDEKAEWGYYPFKAKEMQGVQYELRVPDAVRREMFRGYDATEIIGLAAESNFVARHRFPPFSRWKWGETEQSMSAALNKQIETRFDRKVVKSRYIGHLREEDGRIGIWDLGIVDGEAMVVIGWTRGGKVRATYVQTAEVDPGEDGMMSVWNVDDEGDYGIPSLLCVAFDNHDNVILWFDHSAPESVNLFGLRQQGDQLQVFSKEQWYRRVDL